MTITRRGFLKLSTKLAAASGASLIVPVSGCAAKPNAFAQISSASYQDEGFIQILATGEVHFVLPRDEMGQGIYHGLTTLIAEELAIAPERINVHFAPVDKTYTNTGYNMQGTWGSSSIREHYLPLRQAAANARETILKAASTQLSTLLNTDPSIHRNALTLNNGFVVFQDNKYPMGDFIQAAAQLTPVDNAPLKAASEFKHIGKHSKRIDITAKVTGQASYGIDLGENVPNLHRATVIHGPSIDSTLVDFDASKALALEGVTDVVAVPTGLAIVAKHYWQVQQAIPLIEINWSQGDLATFNSNELPQHLTQKLSQESGVEAFKQGGGSDALNDDEYQALNHHSATYFAPYLAHMTMEPMNCIVHINDEQCDIWVGTQAPEFARNGVADLLDLDRDKVSLHNQFMGGGFGRRVGVDYVLEAAHIARQTNKPIQLIWSRTEDLHNDYYRPPALIQYQAKVDDNGYLKVLSGRRAGPNIFPYVLPEALPAVLPAFVPSGVSAWLAKRGGDVINNWKNETSSVEGLFEDYLPEHCEIRNVTYDPGIRTGYWRGVGHSLSGFFKETFIDELAYQAAHDPIEFRLKNLKDEGLKQVLSIAAKQANWPTKPASTSPESSSRGKRALGVAVHRSLKTAVAQIADVSVEADKIIVHSVTCVIDCGVAINPDVIKAQMEGSIIFGMSAALNSQVKIAQGQITQTNFHDYPIMRYPQAPQINVYIVPSTKPPTGVGEPGVPPIAAAIGNAIYAATGKRLRSLPLALNESA
ncbi:xanthine dehydrogenase family protein molybdopterin-binding subunit [Thalassotalea euphylliae]|uniref:Xanthine dehydrogenase family protein molybdopterin-binding subunit n=1 Tax=Thalassotalea euphylliae TaxID=1655234 RepID=A0A3E0UCH1_9GAMM|nr:molybdopterin cofactor-binding domain-containing protein [Thalassotalea euphylliae]REL34277.1 xanthine dehydrogenase family protein molybdopterin-binding subunit [Thalassotalea euphylliae]